MKDYTNYEVEDFLLDDSFIQWVKGTHTELEEFWQSWLQQHPNRAEIVWQAKEIVLALRVKPGQDLDESEVSQIVSQVHDRHQQYSSPPSGIRHIHWYQQRWLRIAASIVLLAGLGFWRYMNHRNDNTTLPTTSLAATLEEKKNPTSRPMLVRLADGTSVVLQPGASLRADRLLAGPKREVYLVGEAFFEVTKNPNRPFLVYTHELVTKVVGTSFSIQANETDDHIKVVVNTGKVSVSTQEGADKENPTSGLKEVLLIPNQQVTFYRQEVRLVKDTVQQPSPLSVSLAKTRFDFVQTPLSKVLSTLEEAYGVDIVYNEKAMANCLLTASLADQPLYDKLTLIGKAIDARFEMTDGKIVLNGQGCQDTLDSSDTIHTP